ncbi:MAG TPA: universal stress protein [bacterium]|nr:universal stress protein [bacterium]
MKRVLLILSASRVSTLCVDDALATAERECAELVALFILDTVGPRDVQERVSHEGFLGEAPSGRLLRALRRERKHQGVRELAEIAQRAEKRGIACRTDLEEGEFLTRALAAAQTEAPAVIFVAKRERAALARLMSGSRAEELKEAAPCEVTIHEGGNG